MDKQIEKLLDVLVPIFVDYSNNYKVDEVYDYKIDRKIYNDIDLFSENDLSELKKSKTPFDENVLLKEIISDKLVSKKNNLNYYYWIVKQWGGITKFNETDVIINDFFKQIKNGKIESKFYNRISSFSKIAAFKFPDKYYIYDSKVAYVLNWILLKSKKETFYFPIPEGRNTDLTKNYNMDTIISLFNEGKYFEKKYAYIIFCELIDKIFSNMNKFDKAYYIEMFLWGLFENIVLEIKQKVKITIDL
jgi:hypothetical protein